MKTWILIQNTRVNLEEIILYKEDGRNIALCFKCGAIEIFSFTHAEDRVAIINLLDKNLFHKSNAL